MKELERLILSKSRPVQKEAKHIGVSELDKLIMEAVANAATKAAVSERQEWGMLNAINAHASVETPITLIAGTGRIAGVIGATKMSGCNKFGCEMYTDVVVITEKGEVNVSCKGSSAPSIAGGGLLGAKALIPDIIPNFLEAAERWYLENGYTEGDLIPDIYGQLNDKDKRLAVIGTEDIGGPIDYMYIGPMEVKSQFEGGTLTISGDLIPAPEYAETHDIYFRIRKRRNDQPFVPGVKDKSGFPLLMGRSPTKGDRGRRIVFVNKVPKTRNIVEF